MPIKGLSDRRRLPRAGVIRLGIKKIHPETKNEYPEETDYFVCPPLVRDIYDNEPKELSIMFPIEDEGIFFRQDYKRYGRGILLCKGDGENAICWDFDKGGFKEIKCPCEYLKEEKCKPVGVLQFLLPEVKEAVGVWQISTSSKNSIIDVNSGIDYVRSVAGRVAMIPLVLKREPLDTHRIEGNKIKKGKHFPLKLSLGMSLIEIQKLAQLPPARALLPEPDESQRAVDDLFPKNGFKPEDEKEPAKPKEDLAPHKQELSFILKKFRDLGGSLTQKEEERLDVLEDIEGYEDAIKHFKVKMTALEDKQEKPKKASDSEKPKKETVSKQPETLFEGEKV